MNKTFRMTTQSRILALTMTVILVMAGVLIALTAQQSRRAEKAPPATESLHPAPPTTAPQATTRAPETTAARAPAAAAPETTEAAPESQSAAAPVNAEPLPDALPDFISPVTGVISQHHSADVPVYSLTMADWRTHTGVDIACADGAPVRAAAAGIVREVWSDPLMGQCLSIDHAGGARSVYKNLAPALPDGIAAGAAVKAGEVIGQVGESALIEIGQASHLHYELEIAGAAVDPADFMLIGGTDTGFEG